MNAYAILYVNEHLQDLLDEAASSPRVQADQPACVKRIASAASLGQGAFSAARRLQPVDPPDARRLSVPELRPPPLSFRPSSHNERPPVPPPGVVVFVARRDAATDAPHRCQLGAYTGSPCPEPSLREEVDACSRSCASAGRHRQAAGRTDWGGYSGYFTDPDGHHWEVAWNPFWPMRDDGRIDSRPARGRRASMSRSVRPSGRRVATRPRGRASSTSSTAPSRRSPASSRRRTRPRRLARSARAGSRAVRRPPGSPRWRPPERVESRPSTAGTSVGMSPPTTMTRSAAVSARGPASSAGERPLERSGVVHQVTPSGTPRIALGRGDHHDRRRRPPGQRRSRGRAAAGRRSARRACRGRTATSARRPGRSRRSARSLRVVPTEPAGRAPSGPGTCPSGVRRRIARRSRSSRIAITYLRLVPVASRKAAGVSGARAAIAMARAARVAVGRHGVGQVGLEDDDPRRPFQRPDAGAADRPPRGPPRPAAAARAPRARLQPVHRGRQGRVRDPPRRRPGRRTTSPSRTSRPSATSSSTTCAAAAAPRPRRDGHRPAERRGGRRRAPTRGGLVADRRDRRVAASGPHVGREVGPATSTGAVQVEPGARRRPAASAATRIRGLTPPRDPARRRDVEDDAADRRLAVPARRTNRSPARERDGLGQPDDPGRRPVGRSSASRPAPTDRRVHRGRPGMEPAARPIGDGPAGTRRGPGPWRRRPDRPSAPSRDAARRRRSRRG